MKIWVLAFKQTYWKTLRQTKYSNLPFFPVKNSNFCMVKIAPDHQIFHCSFTTTHWLFTTHFKLYWNYHRVDFYTLTDAPMMMKMWTSDCLNSSSSCSSFLSSPNTSERDRGMLLISEEADKHKVKLKNWNMTNAIQVKPTFQRTNTDCYFTKPQLWCLEIKV